MVINTITIVLVLQLPTPCSLVYWLLGFIYIPSNHQGSSHASTLANILLPVSASAKHHLTQLTFHRKHKFSLQEQRCFSLSLETWVWLPEPFIPLDYLIFQQLVFQS